MKDKLLGVKKGNIPQYRSLLDQAVKYVIPRFERTYQVTIETQPNGEQMLICRGGNENAFRCHWCKHGRACDHMYRLLERSPTKRDALPRWHIDYLHFYGRDDTITQHYIKLRDNVRMRGVPLTDPEVRHIKSLFPVGQGSRENLSLHAAWILCGFAVRRHTGKKSKTDSRRMYSVLFHYKPAS